MGASHNSAMLLSCTMMAPPVHTCLSHPTHNHFCILCPLPQEATSEEGALIH